MKPKIIALYLPQFHQIPENDEFWGKGFTDWVTVKNAKPLFEGHYEPRVPLNGKYYDLSEKSNIEWQAKLANEYRIDGFGIYHYWFNNEKNILTKPAEIILNNKDISIDYFFAWDNGNWKRSWSNVQGNDWAPVMEQKHRSKSEPQVLIPYIVGEEKDWEIHYNWLKPFFQDNRYLKKDNRPLFIIFNYSEQISKMCSYWNSLAQKDGFNGMFFIFRYAEHYQIPDHEYVFKYEPLYSGWRKPPSFSRRVINKILRTIGLNFGPRKYEYDEVWSSIIENAEFMENPHCYTGAFVSYDDTPRRGKRGTLVKGATPEKFKKYLSRLIEINKQQSKEFVFLTAWNEWGEGAYLEPDERTGFQFLEAIKTLNK